MPVLSAPQYPAGCFGGVPSLCAQTERLGWTSEEEHTIEAICQADGADRLEAICRMQRRRYGFQQRREGVGARRTKRVLIPES
jgi:hypothetical protein